MDDKLAAAPDAPAENSSETSDELVKSLSGFFTVGLALLGVLGATTGGLARLQRNGGPLLLLGLLFLLAAVVCGMVAALTGTARRKGWLIAGVAMVGAALLLAVSTSWSLAQQRDRPRVAAVWKETGDSLVLQVTSKATGLRVDDRLTVLITAPQRNLAFYFGQTGPDGEGAAEQSAEVAIPAVPGVDAIQVSAYVGNVYAACDGTAYDWAALDQTGELKPLSDTVRPACLTLNSIPTVSASS